MRTPVCLERRGPHDTGLERKLKAHPYVQRAILGFARHETWRTGRQFPSPIGRIEMPHHGRAVFHRQVNSLAEKGQARHHGGADFATPRSLETAAATRAAAADTSWSLVKRPTLKRSELPARVSLKPIPVSTCDASGLSAAHAEPAETARSRSSKRRLSPSTPGNATFKTCGARRLGSP